jgi:type I restriction-modification system DNA methylase subunit
LALHTLGLGGSAITKNPTTSGAFMSEQKFLQELEKKLWNAADKLRSTLDAAQYKHAVFGLLFVKYVSDAFDLRRKELTYAVSG